MVAFEAQVKMRICRTLQDIVVKQRIQYHGCVALTNQEILVGKLNAIQKERHEVFLALQSAKAVGNPPAASPPV